jgi:hypothetical protein
VSRVEELKCVCFAAAGASPRGPDGDREDASVRDPRAGQARQLLSHVALQVPDALQTHRRHLAHHLPAGVRALQPGLLVHLPVPRGGRGTVSAPPSFTPTLKQKLLENRARKAQATFPTSSVAPLSNHTAHRSSAHTKTPSEVKM